MQWTDEALILAVRPHGETAAVVELLTRAHGRFLALVHGGQSRTRKAMLQPASHVDATWSARLSEHLGHARLELRRAFAATALDSPLALQGLASMAAVARVLPERDPCPSVFETALFVLGFLDDDETWPALYVRWELGLLAELGFGLDLAQCAASGRTTDLAYVSPRSGRAVSVEAGEPYRDKLFALPPFLRPRLKGERSPPVTPDDLVAGARLTGYFLETRAYASRNQPLPQPRQRLGELIARVAGASARSTAALPGSG